MKKLFTHIVSYLMVLVILVATLQLSVTKMTCLMSGKIVYSLEKMDDCAPVKKGCTVEERCCDFHIITFDYHTISILSSFDFEIIKTVVTWIYIAPIVLDEPVIQTSFHYFHNLPPPLLSGLQLLKFIQVYRL